MSYLDRLRAKISAEGAKPELTKPTKPGYVSFVGTHPSPARQISDASNETTANDETTPRPDLPLLAAVIEFQGLIDRLCRMRGHDEAVRRQLHAALNGKAPETVFP